MAMVGVMFSSHCFTQRKKCCFFFLCNGVSLQLTVIKQIRGSLNKFPDFFRMGTFIDNTHMKLLVPFKVNSSDCNALVVSFQQLLEGSMEFPLCEHVNDLHHSLFHLNCLITTACELWE